MKVVLVDSDHVLRETLGALLRHRAVAVETFSEPHTALFYLLGWLEDVDGVLVNDDEGEWSSWLLIRLEMLLTSVPVFAYSGREPERGARLAAGAPAFPQKGRQRRAVQPEMAEQVDALLSTAAARSRSARG